MKVLHISGARSWGGNEQQLEYLVEGLKGEEVNQILFCFKDTPVEKAVRKYEVDIVKIPRLKPYQKTYRQLLKAVINEHQPDIIHLHTSDSVTGYVITDLLYGLKTVAIFSKKGISRKVSYLSKFKYNYKGIVKILCVSETVKDHFKAVIQQKKHHKLCVVHDGIKLNESNDLPVFDLRDKYSLPEESLIVGNVANHTRAKDLKTFVKTVDYIINKKKTKNVYFVQIGKFSSCTSELKQMVESFGLERKLFFLNFVPSASEMISQFDIFLMTSEREGGPTSVLEAFSKKKPVVSTCVGIIPEAIEDGSNGYICEVGDNKSLAEAVLKLTKDSALRRSFGNLAYEKTVNNYTSEVLVSNTLNVYKQILF